MVVSLSSLLLWLCCYILLQNYTQNVLARNIAHALPLPFPLALSHIHKHTNLPISDLSTGSRQKRGHRTVKQHEHNVGHYDGGRGSREEQQHTGPAGEYELEGSHVTALRPHVNIIQGRASA